MSVVWDIDSWTTTELALPGASFVRTQYEELLYQLMTRT